MAFVIKNVLISFSRKDTLKINLAFLLLSCLLHHLSSFLLVTGSHSVMFLSLSLKIGSIIYSTISGADFFFPFSILNILFQFLEFQAQPFFFLIFISQRIENKLIKINWKLYILIIICIGYCWMRQIIHLVHSAPITTPFSLHFIW